MKYEKLHLKDYFEFLGNNNADPTLELYLPYNLVEINQQNRKRPCIIVCPGGGYGMCSEREAEPIALNFLNQGFNAFLLNYSVAPHRFPTQLCEVASVLELIYKNADKWNCDTEKIAIIGFSAGGHLVAHYSTMYDCKEVREVFPDSKPVNASVLCYPVITADEKYAHKGSFINLLGHEPDENEVDYFSADRRVSEKTPPAFIWHTAEDGTVPVMNSLLYASAMSEKKIPYELHIYPHGHHGISLCNKEVYNDADITDSVLYASSWTKSLEKWLKLTFNL